MKISQKGLYALQAMMMLARHYNQGAIRIRDIAYEEALPEKFLELILLELKNARIVESARGAKGGYQLRRPPSEVQLSEIIRLVDGPLAPFGDAEQLRSLIDRDAEHRALYQVFLQVRDAAAKILENTTLADIVGNASPKLKKRKKEETTVLPNVHAAGGKVIKKSQILTSTISIAIVAILLLATAFAQTGTTSASKPANRRAVRKTEPSASRVEVQQLKEVVQAQQQQINQQSRQMEQLRLQLQQVLDAAHQATSAAQQFQHSADRAQSIATQAQQSAADTQRVAEQASSSSKDTAAEANLLEKQTKDADRQLAALEAIAGRFRFSADMRVRGEAYNQNTVPDRNRARIRVRLGVDGQLNEDFMGGIAIATGSMGDPTSTNETLTNVFDRKTIALDRGFITYNPVAHNWLSLTGGKFAYTWQRTSATFDPDLNPEGFNEKLSFNYSGPVQNFTVQGIELLYNESTVGQDSYALGGQISARVTLGPWTATPSFLSLKWNRPDAILQESAFATQATTTGVTGTTSTTSFGPFPLSGEGQGCAKGLAFPSYASCVFAPNGLTNASFTDSKGVPHFYSGYNYADFILNNQVQSGIRRFPINLLLEFEDNLAAENHPLNSKGTVLTNLGSQNKEYGGDLSLGQTKNKNDVQFGYAWYREEQDAVIASFVESDQRAPTNILQNRFYGLWKVRSNTVASFTWWHGRTLNTNLENNAALFNNWSTANKGTTITAPGQKEPYLNRLQFDLIYTY